MRQAKRKNPSPILNAHMAQRLNEGLLLIYCAIAVFILVALISYTHTDPSWSTVSSSREIANWGGKVGAWLADFLYLMLGFVAFVLPLTMLYWCIKSFPAKVEEKAKKNSFISDRALKGIGLIFMLVSSCGIIHTYFGRYGAALPARAGGIIGYLVSKELSEFLNVRGSLILLFTGLLCGVTLTTGFSWVELTRSIATKLRNQWQLFWQNLKEKTAQKLSFNWFKSKKTGSKTKMREWSNEDENDLPVIEAKTRFEIEKPQLKEVIKEVKPAPVIVKAEKPRTVAPSKEKVQSEIVLKPGSLPPLTLLNPPTPVTEKPFTQIRFDELSALVEQRLLDFGVEARVVAVRPGPVITCFELELAPGIKASKITGLARDIARSLSVASVRVVEVIPGKPVIGLEIANENREVVALREILESNQFKQLNSPVSLALGKDISGVSTVVDLARMPHLLVAGTTGSGKSVSLNAMLVSMLYKATPEQLRLILIDPKMLELSIYEGIPHLLTPVITDMKDASNALRWSVVEMDKRYKLMASLGVRNLAGY
ncbi:MAG TPA: DNA translocase FtsK 4TM domain-containing protein, partial [Gammaproteobacteria bacterium]|nr:DNA translocase FtsK 4TM domain-containing protein [Gammaproteobacteria bacterium]